MKPPAFIAVEGPIGVGKTTLARAVGHHFGFPVVEEIAEENPFLGKFYQNVEEWSFQTEMFFLCNRFKQLEDVQRDYLARNQAVTADYHIFKNEIFASRTLTREHYDKYMQIYHLLTDDLPKPNVVIYLTASLETLLNRIAMRGRKAETHLSTDYLKQLRADYETFMERFQAANQDIPVLRIDGDKCDFVKNQSDLAAVLKQLHTILNNW
ncbi:MAG TPA: deoxynucleoside kinase [Bacillales bacterium]|nr:deoxynucleoside kinase [Bacillales bacterium]